ncbi:MAG TPA: DUF368 domain-containing protein [Longimicrobiaceae bacterium]|nr:DUF368 domain-containing protein [Longimicrobiaceae bacterium]
MRTRTKNLPLHFAQGLLMGTADIIPGVSGGTMALIVGVYERLIDSISNFFTAVAAPLRGDTARARQALGEVEWGLVIPLALGIVTAIGIASRIIPPLLERYPAEARGLFFGLVAASIAIPWLRLRSRGPRMLAVVAAAAVLAFVLVGLPATHAGGDPSLPRVFGSAAVAICAMILPGVSGAFLLEVMGMYEPTLRALKEMNPAYVLTFVAGAATGIGLFSKLLDWLLEHRHDLTMAALVGLMAGSLRALWPWQEAGREVRLPGPGDPVAMVLLLAALGFAAVGALVVWEARQLRAGPAR